MRSRQDSGAKRPSPETQCQGPPGTTTVQQRLGKKASFLYCNILETTLRVQGRPYHPSIHPSHYYYLGMPSPISERHGHDPPESGPDILERSPLIKHPDSVVVYGVAASSPPSSTDDDDDDQGFSAEPSDEEALVGSRPGQDAHAVAAAAPLSTKTMLWTVLPMLLGQSTFSWRPTPLSCNDPTELTL